MLSEFVIHGVPQGYDSWGATGDRYYETFYGIGDLCKGAKTAFVVEIRKDSKSFCAYYTYVRPLNVVAYGGRTGSYFGMSLKVVGQYCTDVYSLYQLFDKVYEEKIVGTIIEKSGNTEKYLVASFSDADDSLKAIAQLADNQVKTVFSGDFDDIDASFTKQYATSSIYCNLDDVNSEAFFNTTRLYGKVFVSTEYKSKDALIAAFSASDKKLQSLKADYEKQITELQAESNKIPQLNNRIASLDKECKDTQKIVEDLRSSNKSLSGQVSSLERKLKDSQQECAQLKSSSNVGEIANKLEPSLKELLNLLQPYKKSGGSSSVEYETDHTSHRASHRRPSNKLTRFIPAIVTAIIGILFIVLLWKGIQSGPQITALKEENAALEQKYNSLSQEHAKLLAENASKRAQDEGAVTVKARSDNYPDASFELLDEEGSPVHGTVQMGKNYTVNCLGVDQKGEWKADGLLIKEKKKNPTSAEVTKSDKVILSYYVKKEKVLSVEFKVTQ